MKIINKLKEWINPPIEIKQNTMCRYKYTFKTYNGEVKTNITNKYWVWDKDQFVKLELLYKNNCIKQGDKYYSDIVSIEEIEVYDKMILFYDDYEFDVVFKIGRCATKEEIEEYNERIFNKYGKVTRSKRNM